MKMEFEQNICHCVTHTRPVNIALFTHWKKPTELTWEWWAPSKHEHLLRYGQAWTFRLERDQSGMKRWPCYLCHSSADHHWEIAAAEGIVMVKKCPKKIKILTQVEIHASQSKCTPPGPTACKYTRNCAQRSVLLLANGSKKYRNNSTGI